MSEANRYAVQINVKVGDHLINVQGDSVAEVVDRLDLLAEQAGQIHGALEKLDGRPATEIVQKDNKAWGARSQSYRSYPKSATASTTQPSTSSPTSAPNTSDATSLLKDQLGATVVTTVTHSEPSQPTAYVSGSNPEICPEHGLKRRFHAAGTNTNTGKEYSASYRCPAAGCKPMWQRKDGSFQ